MHQMIGKLSVYVVEFDTMPELPITGLTVGEQAWQDLVYAASYPHGPDATLAGMRRQITYAQALTHAIETGVITEPGKYGIHLVPGKNDYEIYTITE